MENTADLLTSIAKLLAAVDFKLPPHADVRVINLWRAATALQELSEAMKKEKENDGTRTK